MQTLVLTLLLGASAAPSLVFSDQLPADRAAVFHARTAGGEPRALFSLPVAPGHVPRASLSPDGRTLAATTLLEGGHPERHGVLWRADLLTGVVRRLAERVLYLERPLVRADGSVLFMRVTRVLPAPPERSAVGELDAVETEVLRATADGEEVLLRDVGYGLHFAGEVKQGLVLYRVAREEAAFYLLPASGGAWRRLADAPTGPFARDFSVAGGTVSFAATTGSSARAGIFALGVRAGTLRVVHEALNGHPSPLASASGVLALDGEPGSERLVTLGTKRPALLSGLAFPLATGGGLVAVRRQTALAQELWLVPLDGGSPSRVPT
ncbi:MAG: hypothetical protein ACK4N5_26070, partial [Myxococcales bacterium]